MFAMGVEAGLGGRGGKVFSRLSGAFSMVGMSRMPDRKMFLLRIILLYVFKRD